MTFKSELREVLAETGLTNISAQDQAISQILDLVEKLIGEDEKIDWIEWHKKTQPYGGTREEFDRLEDIINNENNLKAHQRNILRKGG